MTDEDKEEPTVIWSDEVKEKVADDPELGEFVRNFSALARQAMEGVQSGKYASFEEAMFILTGKRPIRIDEDWDDSDT
jgi:hypothetical protein